MARDPQAVPRAAASLGALAVVPFVGCAAATWLADASWHATAAFALSAYAAVVIAFIGAIHWGLAFSPSPVPTGSLVWGVVPSIVAWAALLVPPSIGLAVHAVVLVACYLVDRATYPRYGVERWLGLRGWLTVPAVLACVAGAAGA